MAKVLILPGLHNSGPSHWQSLWLEAHPEYTRVVQEDWREGANRNLGASDRRGNAADVADAGINLWLASAADGSGPVLLQAHIPSSF